MYRDRRRFANFFFGWMLDNLRSRLIFYTIPDVNGRNIQRLIRYVNGRYIQHLIRYNRWVEEGYENELMRLTDYVNSLRLFEREKLLGLTKLKPMRPSEKLVEDLWSLARGYMSFEEFHRNYYEGYYETMVLW